LMVGTAVELVSDVSKGSTDSEAPAPLSVSIDTLRVSSLDTIVMSACDATETDETSTESSAVCLTATEEIVRGGRGGGTERGGGEITSGVRDNGATS